MQTAFSNFYITGNMTIEMNEYKFPKLFLLKHHSRVNLLLVAIDTQFDS